MTETKSRSLAGIAGIVAAATLLSKVFGLVRQMVIAAVFGTGPAIGAYNFSYVVPGFLLVLLGGINGPFHSAIVSTVSKRPKEEVGPIIETITTLVVGLLAIVTVGLVFFANPIMHLVAPGLYISPAEAAAQGISPEQLAKLAQTKAIAIQQFQIMAPMAMLAGLIGIGFGTLNAADHYWLPSVSPLFSSLVMILGLGGLFLQVGSKITLPEYAVLGGAVLAWTTVAGALLQWLIQIPAQWKSGMGGLRPRFDFGRSEVQEVLRVMGPATFSSGMLQINVWTDLFFASFIPDATAAVSAMGYAGLLVQTPLGILSSMILVPLLPIFTRLSDPENWDELKGRIRQGMLLTAVTMLPLGALMVALSDPIVRVVYERYAFDAEASQITIAVLMAYSVGMFVYLGRDVLVRVFYALGDADTPFRVSIINIFLNALLDFLFVKPFGAPGIVLATVGVNLISMVTFLWILNRRLNGLAMRRWILPIAGLALGSGVSGGLAWWVLGLLKSGLGDRGFFIHLIQLCIAGGIGLVVFAGIALQLKLPEVDILRDRILQKLRRR